ncbi:MAG: DUF222 domain-containing protein [Myxococcales bacterium]|nr:DUF222 domain-containing protein [Myxococcales bacterium]
MDAAPSPSSHPSLNPQQVVALGEQIAEHAAHLDAATHRLLADLRAFDRAGGWASQGARTCAEWLSWRLGWSGNRAREHVRVAQRLGELPLIDLALRRGELSYCKVRALTRVATPDSEALLVETARYATGLQLELICRKYAMVQRGQAQPPSPEADADRRRISKRELDDGMVGIHLTLHPEEAAVVWEALTAVAREREGGGGFCRIDAAIQIAQAVLRGDRPERAPTEVVVTVAAEVLDGSSSSAVPVAVMSDGTCVSSETARRLACDAGIVELHEDTHGTPLSVGRKTRSIPPAIQRALAKRDPTCRFPGCCNRVFVEGHHIEHWAHGGETSLENLVRLCDLHHRHVHEYGYRVTLDAQQRPRFFDPKGVAIPDVPPPCTPAGLGVDAIRRLNQPLAITPATNAPRWDGRQVNYDWVIEDLVRADRRS